MKKYPLFVLTLIAASVVTPVSGNEDRGFVQWMMIFSRTKEVRAVDHALYAEEGVRNMSLRLSPWVASDSILKEEDLKSIQEYVYANSAEKPYHKRARKITRSIPEGEAPMRITKVKYIKRKHHALTDKMIKGNKGVGWLSNCSACHIQAEHGVFDDDTVDIPNYGKWDD